MAVIYAPPKQLGDPPMPGPVSPYDPNDQEGWRKAGQERWEAYERDTEAWVASVRAWAREHGSGPIRGEIVRFPIADGYAQYVVMSGTQLIHLPVYDGWQIPAAHARGLRAADLKAMVAQDKALEQLFTERKKA